MKQTNYETFVKWHDRYSFATESFKMVFQFDKTNNVGRVRCFDVDKSGIGLKEVVVSKITKSEFEWARKQPAESLAMLLRGEFA